MIKIKNETASFGIVIPEKLEEITPEMLTEITKAICVPKHYCIIATCLETTLFTVASSLDSESVNMVAITPMIAKINEEDGERMSTRVGLQAIIHPSDVERGGHLDLPTMLSFKKFRKYLKEDRILINSIIKGKLQHIDKDEVMPSNTKIILFEFKIVPVMEIRSSIILGIDPIDPFIYEDTDKDNGGDQDTSPIN